MRKKSAFREALEYWLARAVLASLEHGPRRVAFTLARFYTRVLDLAIPRLRRVALRNLAMALPELDPAGRSRIADGVFRSVARLLVTFARFPRITAANIQEWIRYEGNEHFDKPCAAGTACCSPPHTWAIGS